MAALHKETKKQDYQRMSTKIVTWEKMNSASRIKISKRAKKVLSFVKVETEVVSIVIVIAAAIKAQN